jgi:non-ribosomal peptide synthetase component F
MSSKSIDGDGVQYWLSQLADAPRAIELPRVRRPAEQLSRARVMAFDVPHQMLAGIAACKVTVFAYLLAVFALTLHADCQQGDLCIGTDVTTRDRSKWESVVGLFVNRLVLRISVDDHLTVLEFLRKVQQVVSSALSWRHTSLDRLARRLGVPPGSGLFNVLFGLHNNPHHVFRLDENTRCTVEETHLSVTEVDLSLYFTTTPSTLRGALTYREECFEADWIQNFVDQYLRLAAAIGGDLQASVRDVIDRDCETMAGRCRADLSSVGVPTPRGIRHVN